MTITGIAARPGFGHILILRALGLACPVAPQAASDAVCMRTGSGAVGSGD
jgi:hypothetical protein